MPGSSVAPTPVEKPRKFRQAEPTQAIQVVEGFVSAITMLDEDEATLSAVISILLARVKHIRSHRHEVTHAASIADQVALTAAKSGRAA